MLVAYFIIGVVLLTLSCISQSIMIKEEFKDDIRHPLWWVVTAGCVVLWPVLIASAIIDGIRGKIEL